MAHWNQYGTPGQPWQQQQQPPAAGGYPPQQQQGWPSAPPPMGLPPVGMPPMGRGANNLPAWMTSSSNAAASPVQPPVSSSAPPPASSVTMQTTAPPPATNLMGQGAAGQILGAEAKGGPPLKPMFIGAGSWSGAKRGYVFKTGGLGTGYYKDDSVLRSNAHHISADMAEEAARKAEQLRQIEERRAKLAADEMKHAMEEAQQDKAMSERAPLEALAAKLLAESYAEQAAFLTGELDDDDDEEEEQANGEKPRELTEQEKEEKRQQKQNEQFQRECKRRDQAGEDPISMEAWLASKEAKKQEWFNKENARRAAMDPPQPALTFKEWEEMEAKKKKEKKRQRARERSKHDNMELAIVPGQLWSTSKNGMPENLPPRIRQKITKKLMDEVIMRPSPEEQERLRIIEAEKIKAKKLESSDHQEKVLVDLKSAIDLMRQKAAKLPAVQRRLRDQRLKERLKEEGAEVATEELIILEDSSFDPPDTKDMLQAKLYQAQASARFQQEAFQKSAAQGTNPVLGMLAASQLNQISAEEKAKFSKLAKAAVKLHKASMPEVAEEEKAAAEDSESEKKHKKKHKKRHHRSRSSSRHRSSRRDRSRSKERDSRRRRTSRSSERRTRRSRSR